MRKKMITLLLLALVTALGAAPANAELRARSQVIDPATGYPTWYQDTNGLALTNCLDENGFCIAAFTGQPLPADKALISAANFPDESFYYQAFALGTSPGGTINLTQYRADLEAGFGAAGVIDGQQAVFSRIRIRADVSVTGQYIVTHPYGVETFNIEAIVAGPEINVTIDQPGLVPLDFDTAVNTTVPPFVGPTFLTAAATPGGAPLPFVTDPATGNRYLANPLSTVAVTGSPFGTNFLQITAPNADNLVINAFNLQGKLIGLEVTPSPVTMTTTVGTVPPVATTLTVTNLTSAAITFPAAPATPLAIGLPGVNVADFTLINDTCTGANLPAADPAQIPPVPAGTCTVGVQFDPVPMALAARTATLTVTPPAATGFPPVLVALNGTAQFDLTLNAGANGTVTNADGSATVPNPEKINAGLNKVYKVAPSAGFLPLVKVTAPPAPSVRQVVAADGTVTIPTIGAHTTTDVTFLRAGDVDQSGGDPTPADALQALKISVGIGPVATDVQFVAADVGPLVNNALKANGKVNISDAMVILRRAVGLAPLW